MEIEIEQECNIRANYLFSKESEYLFNGERQTHDEFLDHVANNLNDLKLVSI